MAKEPTVVTVETAKVAQTVNASARGTLPLENVYGVILCHGKNKEGLFGSVVNYKIERDDDGDVLSIGDSKNAWKDWAGDTEEGYPSFLKSLSAVKVLFGPKKGSYGFVKGLDVGEMGDNNAMTIVGFIVKHPK